MVGPSCSKGKHEKERAGDCTDLVERFLQAEPHPLPITDVTCESMASFAGKRMAFPIRSRIRRNAAASQLPANTRSGIAPIIRYPAMTNAQYRRDLPAR